MGLKYNMKSLGDICSMKYGKMPKREDLVDNGGYPIFTGYLISGYHKEHMFREPEIVVVARGIGGAGDIKMSPPKSWITNISIFLQITDPEVDKSYLYWKLASTGLRHLRTGSAQPQIIIADLKNYIVELPLLQVQRKIATILSTYDDLIENNLRRIKILEEMAQNLYREWFVNFRFPGHEQTRFVDSPLGRIPEGWEVRSLNKLITGHIGGGWGNEDQDNKHSEPAWVIRGTDIPSAKKCDVSKVPFRYHTVSNLKTRKLIFGDIIFEVSGGSKGQPLGRTLLITSELMRLFKGYPVICASFCKRVQPNSERYAPELLYMSYIEGYESGEIEQYQVQSTGISNFKWADYNEKVFRSVPPRLIQDRFIEITSPMLSQIAILGLKNHNLRQTRGLLLPKLISGEVDVSELDIKVPEEEAV